MRLLNDCYRDEVKQGFFVPNIMKRSFDAQIEILKDIDSLCKSNDITYYAAWGTLLGTVREGGFIPWDDDLDICMKREDYNKFLEISSGLPSNYDVMCFKNNPEYGDFMMRVVNSNFAIDDANMEKFHGFPYICGIDIFPLDYIPSDEKVAKDYKAELSYLVSLAEMKRHENATQAEWEKEIRNFEKNYGVILDRNKNIRQQVYLYADKVLTKMSKEKSDKLAQPNLWIGNIELYYPKWAYNTFITKDFDGFEMPVPIGYDDILKISFREYMKPVIDWNSHNYPAYEDQKRYYKSKYNIEFGSFEYNIWNSVRLDNSENTLSDKFKVLKSANEQFEKCYGILENISEEEMSNDIIDGIITLLENCQNIAYEIGEFAEKEFKDPAEIIDLLNKYCDCILKVSEVFSLENIHNLEDCLNIIEKKIVEALLLQDKKIEPDVKKVLFVCVYADDWKYFKKYYEKYAADSNCEVSVMPIPYYMKNYNGIVTQNCFDKDLFDINLPLVDCEKYDIEKEHPDIIYIQNPYDNANYDRTIAPYFYSSNLKKYTDKLIYVTPYITGEIEAKNTRAIKMMEYYVSKPAVLYADEVIVSSETVKQRYAEVVSEYTNVKKEAWLKKINVDKSRVEANKFLKETPQNWERGDNKKILLYVCSEGTLLKDSSVAINKIKNDLRTFENNREFITVIWRTDLITTNEIKSLDNNSFEQILNLISVVEKENWIVIDKKKSFTEAVMACDAFYGDGCIEANQCRALGKPVMIRNIDLLDEK